MPVTFDDFANIFTANQRINAGLGVNVAPGAAGEIKTSAGIFERSRSVALGEWQNVAYASGNYTASAGVWTVDAADQQGLSYTLIGKTMIIGFSIINTSLSVAAQVLSVKIPGGFTVAATTVCGYIRAIDNGTVVTGFSRVLASGTTLDFLRQDAANFAISTNNTSVQGLAFIPLA